MSKINRKYTKPKTIKQLLAAPTVRRGHIGQVVKFLIDEGRPDEIEETLLQRGVVACVAREWRHEAPRRVMILRKNQRTEIRKMASAFGRRGQYGRRIIHTKFVPGRSELRPCREGYDHTREAHATKGFRWYHTPSVAA